MANEDDRMKGEGALDELKGKVKSGIGGLTGDTSTEVEGHVDQLKGKAKRAAGEVMDEIGDAADSLDNDKTTR